MIKQRNDKTKTSNTHKTTTTTKNKPLHINNKGKENHDYFEPETAKKPRKNPQSPERKKEIKNNNEWE